MVFGCGSNMMNIVLDPIMILGLGWIPKAGGVGYFADESKVNMAVLF